MIVAKPDEYRISEDIRRPNITEHNRKKWLELHDWVKNSPTNIVVSAAFHVLQHYLENEQDYYGEGFAYMFWFRTEVDREVFLEHYHMIIGDI